MNKKIFGLLALVLLLGAGCATTNNTADPNDTDTLDITVDETRLNDEENTDPNPDNDTDGIDSNMDDGTGEVKEFTVVGTPFAYDVETMTVNKGDTVRVTFVNEEGFHDWVLDEFDAATAQLPAGQTETIEFVADEAGEFEYYCSVGNHRQMGMVGTLIVNE